MIDRAVLFMPKIKLSYHDQLNQVQSVMKTGQDNDVTNHIGLFYSKTETELSESI